MAKNKKGTDMKMTAGFGKKRKEKELFGIIGLGRFGMSLAERLAEEGMELIAVDKEREKVNYAATFCENAFLLENLTRDNLEKIGIHQCDTVVVGIGRRLDVSVLTVLNLKNMGVKRVIAKSTSAEQGMVLEKLGEYEAAMENFKKALTISVKYLSTVTHEQVQAAIDSLTEKMNIEKDGDNQ